MKPLCGRGKGWGWGRAARVLRSGRGVVPLGAGFYVHVETSVQQSILHPHNKSGRRFPLNQRIDGGGGGIKGWRGRQSRTLRVLLQLLSLHVEVMNHTKRYLIKTFLGVFHH